VRISLVSIGSDRNATLQLEDLLAAAR